MPQKIIAIVNAGSGSVESEETKRRLEELFKENNLEAEVFLAKDGADIVALAKKAAKSDAEIVCAGGGDGTMSAVAAELIETDKTLGVLPLGTLNHFSKDLNIPQDLSEAVRVIAEGHAKNIDVAEVNGRMFLNNSSIGLYPKIVQKREKQERLGKGKWSAAFWAASSVLRLYPFLDIRLKLGDREIKRKTPFLFVGNNEYEMDFLNIGTRKCLDDGKLSIYLLHRTGRFGLLMLAVRSLFGVMQRAKDFESVCVENFEIKTHHKRLLVARDGEVEAMETPLCYNIRPQALRVIIPALAEQE